MLHCTGASRSSFCPSEVGHSMDICKPSIHHIHYRCSGVKGTKLGRENTTIVWQHPRGSHTGCRQAKRTRTIWGLANCIKQAAGSHHLSQIRCSVVTMCWTMHECKPIHWSSDLSMPDVVVTICRVVVIRPSTITKCTNRFSTIYPVPFVHLCEITMLLPWLQTSKRGSVHVSKLCSLANLVNCVRQPERQHMHRAQGICSIVLRESSVSHACTVRKLSLNPGPLPGRFSNGYEAS